MIPSGEQAPESRRVLVAHPFPDLYGADRVLLMAIRAFREAGHEVLVVVPETGPLIAEFERGGIPFKILPFPVLRKAGLSARGIAGLGWQSRAALGPLRAVIREWKADLVYANTLTIPIWLLAARSMSVPALCHVHEAEEGLPPLLARALTAPLALSRTVVANSQATASFLRLSSSRLRSRIRVVYNGFDFHEEWATPQPHTPPFRLVLVGRLNPRKGQDLAIKAVSLLVQGGHDVSLDLVGSTFRGYDWFERDLRDLADQCGVADHVRFRGFESDIDTIYREADLVLIPSLVESFGNVAVEAMSRGRPVVASRVGGLIEIVSNETGTLCLPNEVTALADAVERYVQAPDLLHEHARNGATEVRERFRYEVFKENLLSVVAARQPGRRARILVAHPFPDLYGADRMLLMAIRVFRREGHEVLVVIPENGPLIPEFKRADVPFKVVPFPVLRKAALSGRGMLRLLHQTVTTLKTLRALIREWGADLVYVNTLTVPIWLLAAKSERIPSFCHVREAEEGILPILGKALTTPLLLATLVLANSRATASFLTSNSPRLTSRIRVLYNGFDFEDEWTPPKPHGGPVRLVLVGRLNPRKGQDVAVKAVAQLIGRGHDVSLEIVGSTFRGYEWFERDLRDLANNLGVADRVVFRGFEDDVSSIYNRADIVLIPSLVESFGNVAVEAMSRARPVVASAVGGLREIVTKETGILCPPDDVNQLAEAIARYLREPDLRYQHAREGALHVRRAFGYETFARQLRALPLSTR